jgi:hypothetical protein
MKVGDLVTFSSTGASLKVVRDAYSNLFFHWDKDRPAGVGVDSSHRSELYRKAQNYLFLGIVVSTKGLTKQQMENVERGMRFSVRKDMIEGALYRVEWTNVPFELPRGLWRGDIRRGRANDYAHGYSLWKRSDLKVFRVNKKKK